MTSGLGGTFGTSGVDGDGIAGPGNSGPGAGSPGVPGIGTSMPGGASNSGGVSMLGTSGGGRPVPGTSSGGRLVPGTSGGAGPPGNSGGIIAETVNLTPARRVAVAGEGWCGRERRIRADDDAAARKVRQQGSSDAVVRLIGILVVVVLFTRPFFGRTEIAKRWSKAERGKHGTTTGTARRCPYTYSSRLDTFGNEWSAQDSLPARGARAGKAAASRETYVSRDPIASCSVKLR